MEAEAGVFFSSIKRRQEDGEWNQMHAIHVENLDFYWGERSAGQARVG